MEILLSIVGGGVITVLTALCVEYLRRPDLRLSIEEPPCDVPYHDGAHPARDARYLRLILRNDPLPRFARWMQRGAALQCRGEITFHHLDGQNIFGRAMVVRWSNSPQPIASQVLDNGGVVQFHIIDFARPASESRIDVYPDEVQLLDVAIRCDNESECYGWNNDAYFHRWRNPDWTLLRGRYLVKVVITSSGQKCTGVFRLVNDVEHRTDFRLIAATEADRSNVR